MPEYYPTIGEYNQLFHKLGGAAFITLRNLTLVPSRTTPVKLYLFGSGAYAAVFKGNIDGEDYAIRCFLSADDDTIQRNRLICDYIENLDTTCITWCRFIDNEISIRGNTFPILMMEWVDGVLINKFVSDHLSNNTVLSELQEKLVCVSNELEENEIGHGDLQCGNIIIEGDANDFKIKLIDYDGMYVPPLDNHKSFENGRSEFQHPKRTLNHFNSEIDRFSIWVIITALEALKYDKALWDEVMQGGYNTLDNFLFIAQDFLNPSDSKLFERLDKVNSDSLNFYVNKIKEFCGSDVLSVLKPELYCQMAEINSINESPQQISERGVRETIKIISSNGEATILNSLFEKIGTTPMELAKEQWIGKTIIASNGTSIKQISLNDVTKSISIDFPSVDDEATASIPSQVTSVSKVLPQTSANKGSKHDISSSSTANFPRTTHSGNTGNSEFRIGFYIIGGVFLLLFIGIIFSLSPFDFLYTTKKSETIEKVGKQPLKQTQNRSQNNIKKQITDTDKEIKQPFKQNEIVSSANSYSFSRSKIIDLLKSYYDSDDGINVYRYASFYNFPIQSYFTYKNVTENEFYKIIRNSWSLTSHSVNTPSYDELQIFRDKGNYSVTYPLKYEYTLKKSDVTKINTYNVNIKLDKNGKIYFIENTLVESEIKPELIYLKNYGSYYPSDINLFETRTAFSKRMKNLVGGGLNFEIKNDLSVETPILIENDKMFFLLCESHNCYGRNAIIIYDFSIDQLHVIYKNGTNESLYTERGSGTKDSKYWEELNNFIAINYNRKYTKKTGENEQTYSSKSKSLDMDKDNVIPSPTNQVVAKPKTTNQSPNNKVKKTIYTTLIRRGIMRKTPSIHGGKIKKIPEGARITILNYEYTGYWKVKYGTSIGYVNEVVLYQTDEMKKIKLMKN